ncbi:MAG: hypothetical protein ACP5IT_11420 [Thermoproteota archaeon]
MSVRRYHVEKNAVEGGADIIDASIPYGKLQVDTVKFEVAIPIVVDSQSVTSTTLATLNGWARWVVGSWVAALIKSIYVELEYATGGAGDIDLYNITDSTKIKDLVAPATATSHTITRVDVTSQVKALTADKTIGIQAAGDGTNAATVYSAKLIVRMGIS